MLHAIIEFKLNVSYYPCQSKLTSISSHKNTLLSPKTFGHFSTSHLFALFQYTANSQDEAFPLIPLGILEHSCQCLQC